MNAKFFSLIGLFLVVIAIGSCKKEDALAFDYHGNDLYLVLKPDSAKPTTYQSRGAVYFNADSMAKANNFPLEAVQSIRLDGIRFTLMDSTTGVTFDLIKNMSVNLATTSGGTGEVLFQNSNFAKKTAGTIGITGIDKDVKTIVSTNKYFWLDVSGELTDTLTRAVNIKTFFTYKVDMKGTKLD